ncbi:MAG: class I SAM-dependent methyltransferase [Gammaproteobacteria bacterium]|nr:class I SAM-dependent methyltransferase [Gammaproteobacteria bacterium]
MDTLRRRPRVGMKPSRRLQPGSQQLVVAADAAGRLCLRDADHPRRGAICIDWSSAGLRRRIVAGRGQALARALGLQRRRGARIADLTAGLGRDGFVLAALGARVTMIERQPLIHALLADALARALTDPALRAAAARVELIHADARDWLAAAPAPDAVYLDPMYPDHGRSALPAGELQWLRRACGDDADAGALLAPALAAAARVVVKRPRRAPPLAGVKPQACIRTAQVRFDLYLHPVKVGTCAD